MKNCFKDWNQSRLHELIDIVSHHFQSVLHIFIHILSLQINDNVLRQINTLQMYELFPGGGTLAPHTLERLIL